MNRYFTIRKLCKVVNATLVSRARSYPHITGIEARLDHARKRDAYFDIDRNIASCDKRNTNFRLVVTSRPEEWIGLGFWVARVSDEKEAYERVCKYILSTRSKVLRIAVGGSTGKTSMKDVIAAVLGRCASTQKSYANSNSYYGWAKQLGRIKTHHKFYIQEIGLNSEGNAELLDKMARIFEPHVSVLTNIGNNHGESYGSKETIYRHKIKIAEHTKDDGIVFLNKDDPFLRTYNHRGRAIFYSIEDEDADLYASDIEMTEYGLRFDIHFQSETINDVHFSLWGRHNVYNALVAFAVARINGFEPSRIVEALADFKFAYSTRQNFSIVAGCALFVDCYNSSLESASSALETLISAPIDFDGKRIAVLGDMLELGDVSIESHRELGRMVSRYGIDALVCYGELIRDTFEEARSMGIDSYYTDDRSKLNRHLSRIIKSGDAVLWKASHSLHLELTIDEVFGTNYFASSSTNVSKISDKSLGPYIFRSLSNGVQIDAYTGRSGVVAFSRFAENSMALRSIGSESFSEKNVVDIVLPDSVVHVGDRAFYKCSKLTSVILPEGLKYIGEEAFGFCSQLQSVIIPSSCLHVGKGAFRNCESLKTVVVRSPKTFIHAKAFDNCKNVVVLCEKDSIAEKCLHECQVDFRVKI